MSTSRFRSLTRWLECGAAVLALGCGTEPPRLASLGIISGNGQTGIAGRSLPVPLEVEAEDEDGNPIEGLALQFEVTAGGGHIHPAEITTDRKGQAAAELVLGNEPGPQQVTVSGSGEVVVRFMATATGAPASVLVQDAGGHAVPGVLVSFKVTEGGGSMAGASVVTDAAGIAAVGQWRLGATGVNTLAAEVDGTAVSGEPVTFVATTTPPGGFDVVVRFAEPPTSAQALAFARAEVRWEQVITGDLPDGSIQVPGGTCGSGTPALNETIDDVVILAAFPGIDGPGNVLAQAGPCLFRDANDDGHYQIGELPGVGIMNFDAEDLAFLVQNDLLAVVVLHEMGHVLGLGSLWSDMGLLADPSLPPANGTDPHFIGSAALAAFDAAGGTAYQGPKVPVENTGGAGNADAHWRESVFDDELMTGFIDFGSNPLSAVSVASLADQGYLVNQAESDPYILAPALRAGASRPSVALPADVLRLPLHGLGKIR